MLYYLVTTLYVFVCLVLLLVILLQQGKGGDMASAFGGGSSQTAFGARGGATLLSKITAAFAVLFMLGALSLAIIGERGDSGSLLRGTPRRPPRHPRLRHRRPSRVRAAPHRQRPNPRRRLLRQLRPHRRPKDRSRRTRLSRRSEIRNLELGIWNAHPRIHNSKFIIPNYRSSWQPLRKWRNWQTHQLEGLAVAIPWGFESPLPHHALFRTIFRFNQLHRI